MGWIVSNVRITVMPYGRPIDLTGDDEARIGISFEGVPILVDIDLWRCDRCAALTQRGVDQLTHEVFHGDQDRRMEAIEERIFYPS